MSNGKNSRKKSSAPKPTGTEYRFKIDAYSPSSMPMARLGEYMKELAIMLGEIPAVHFLHLEAGSTVLVHRIEKEAQLKVRWRTEAVQRGEGPPEARVAYRRMNAMLRDDNATGRLLQGKRGATLLDFPGRDTIVSTLPAIIQHGSVEGELKRIGGSDESIHVLLESEGVTIAGCRTNKQIAKALAPRLFEQVRLHGKGRWTRDAEGVWALDSFYVESFEVLNAAALSDVVAELRRVDGGWNSESLSELRLIRSGDA